MTQKEELLKKHLFSSLILELKGNKALRLLFVLSNVSF